MSLKSHSLRGLYLFSRLQKNLEQALSSTHRVASKAQPDMYAASVGREVKPKLRVMTITVMVWSTVILVIVITVPGVVAMVSLKPSVLVASYILVSLNRAIGSTPCLRWRRPGHEKHCQWNGYHKFSDIFHFDPPFVLY